MGLWVGASATSNTMLQIKADLGEYRKGTGASPCPLARCPWCKKDFTAQSVTLDNPKHPAAVIVGCENDTCDFSQARHRDGVPVVFVDEQVYRELPAFIVGTVDKFAMVPWRAETGMLFGRVAAMAGREMIEPGEPVPRGATRLPRGLRPPELIVQDELHLISGPLGTMVGLYETAIEELCARSEGGQRIVPKVIASTATVRRAAQQVQALMGGRPCAGSRRRARTRASRSSPGSTTREMGGCPSGWPRRGARFAPCRLACTRRSSRPPSTRHARARRPRRPPTRT